MLPVLCLNGPNLELLGRRQPEVYGSMTLVDLEASVIDWGHGLGFDVRCIQSGHDGELVEAIHAASGDTGIIFNPGALTHSSPSLGDAVASVDAPVVEVHISNVRARERWRRRSYLTPVAAASIFGRGPEGYRAALRHLVNRQAYPMETFRYGPHPDQVFDLRRGDSRIGVVLVHGGFWLDAWGRDTVESWAVDLAQRGIPSLNLEYRRMASGGSPVASVSDVAAGLELVPENLGTEEFVVIGHSAGAHLALAAVNRGVVTPAAVVAVGGILDLDAAEAAGIGDGAVTGFDPRHETSPVRFPPPTCPVVLVHGDSDTVVPPAQSRAFADHLARANRQHLLQIVEGGRHLDALDPSSDAWKATIAGLSEVGLALR